MKRPTPAFFAASARGIWSNKAVAVMLEMTTSAPLRRLTRSSSGPLRSAATTRTPCFLRFSFLLLLRDASRATAVMSWETNAMD